MPNITWWAKSQLPRFLDLDFTVDKDSLFNQTLVSLPWLLLLTSSLPLGSDLVPFVLVLARILLGQFSENTSTLESWWNSPCPTLGIQLFVKLPQYLTVLVYLQSKPCQVLLARISLTLDVPLPNFSLSNPTLLLGCKSPLLCFKFKLSLLQDHTTIVHWIKSASQFFKQWHE